MPSDHSKEIIELGTPMNDCPGCGGSGLVAATPGYPGDGTMPCETCMVNGKPTGKVPRIRTRDGRTLRAKCRMNCQRGTYKVTEIGGHIWTGKCEYCQGRSWLPVPTDTAVVVIMDYAMEEKSGNLLSRIIENFADRDCLFTYAAVFAAARKVVGNA